MDKIKLEIEFTGDKIDRDKFMMMLELLNSKFSHMIDGFNEKKFNENDLKTLDDIIKKSESKTILPNWFIGIREDEIMP